MLPDRKLLVPYRLRTVRIGIQVTVLALAALVAFGLLPGHGELRVPIYAAVLIGGSLGGLVVAFLPWSRLLEMRHGLWGMYLWSAADILLITMAVYGTGGGSSELYLVYGMTTVFFGVSYPARGQVGLLAMTFGCYLAVLGLSGWNIEPAVLFLRVTVLGMLAVLTSFPARELMREMASHQGARRQSERWAQLLGTVAGAAREMTLDHERVLDVVVDSVTRLGFEAANIAILDDTTGTYRVAHPRGIPEAYVKVEHPIEAGMVGMVRKKGGTMVVEDYATMPHAIPVMVEEGFKAVIASPVWVDGWLAAVLVGGTKQAKTFSSEEVQAFELLAAQAGLALENARRFEEERSAVERFAELDRLKVDFLATVSHELRTPVTVIQGTGLTLARQWEALDEDTRRELLEGLNANARTLDGIIGTLLDFSRLDSGGPELRRSQVDLADLISDLTMRVEPLFEGRRLACRIERPLPVEVDALLIERALENLLSNAAKHTDPGTKVRVSARRVGRWVEVEVADEGPGIPEAELRHLGDRFFRGGDTNTRRTKGLGLGLALVREMLELHGSELDVASRVGEGSRFSFRLPLIVGSASGSGSSAASTAALAADAS